MKVKKAKYISDYKVELEFSDGIVKIVDFKPFLKNAKNLLVPLLDLNYFKQFSVDYSTICWPNEIDFCPDVLYEVGKEVKKPKTVKATELKPRRATIKRNTSYALSKSRRKTSK